MGLGGVEESGRWARVVRDQFVAARLEKKMLEDEQRLEDSQTGEERQERARSRGPR